ncbi:MAG: serine/threonine-protein kinase [Myxococcota bacterium]
MVNQQVPESLWPRAPRRRDSSGAGLPRQLSRRFDVKRVIGCGGSSDAIEAFDRVSGRPVVLKIQLPVEQGSSISGTFRFEREVEALSSIEHPHVVQLLDELDLVDGRKVLVLERLAELTLEDVLLRMGSLAIQDLVTIGLQLLSACTAVHQSGWVHRDIKPANISIRMVPRLKVVLFDFGLALGVRGRDSVVHSERATRTGWVLGTPAYMPPEQIAGSGATPQSDLYAVCVLLYEAATGVMPFGGQGSELLVGHMNGVCSSLEAAHPGRPCLADLSTFILRGLAKNPRDRFRDCAEARDELLALKKVHGSRWAREEMLRLDELADLG